MPTIQRLTALAIARAMLAGPHIAPGLAARTRACLDTDAVWIQPLAQRCAGLPAELWRRLSPRTLASLVERDPGYRQAWVGVDVEARPTVRRYILRERSCMRPPPLGLDHCQLPSWPHSGALADWLGLSSGGLWRLTRAADWQRRSACGDQHYRYTLLAKPSGGWRLLEVPHPYLMPLQRRLLDDLLQKVPLHQAACGHGRQHSVVDHARAHAAQAVVMRFDLQDFYTSIRASRVHALFTTLGYGDVVARELTALCTTATPEAVLQGLRQPGGLNWQQAQRLRDPHLPQGAPTSAALASLCAFGLDLRLEGLAHVLGARYTRYADDLVLSGGPQLAAARQRIQAWVGHIALEEGFRLNHRKTRLLKAGRRQAVCGVVVNQHTNLPRPEFDRLKAILHRCVTEGPLSQNRSDHPHWRQHLQGRVAWAAQVNPDKAQRLKRLLEQIDWSR